MSDKSIDACIRESLEQYFIDLGESEPAGMYDMLLRTVEKPLLEEVMKKAQNNQSKAAQWLGMNRNTLRKKLLENQILE
jgi:Fis family transcriptional regulator